MKNKKGFVMTETLVVTVFLVTIFTFIYVSIIPLVGQYEDMVSRTSDIDVVYKLYHIRKMLENDANEMAIISTSSVPIDCSDFNDTLYCNKLIQFLELGDYLLIYTNSISNTISSLNNDQFISNNYGSYSQNTIKELKNYLSNYSNSTEKCLILLDERNYTIAHLRYFK